MSSETLDRQAMDGDLQRFEIDGARFHDLPGFFDEVIARLIPGSLWGRNLDAFNDILRGGFGTPDEGFVLVWRNSSLSTERLGFDETIHVLRKRLTTCHPANVPFVEAQLAAAERGEGQTIFDELVEIIRNHGPGGQEADSNVLLELR
jgi:RNAse (barnase) inhibitor barstar